MLYNVPIERLHACMHGQRLRIVECTVANCVIDSVNKDRTIAGAKFNKTLNAYISGQSAAVATFDNANGVVKGTVRFTALADGLQVQVSLSGLSGNCKLLNAEAILAAAVILHRAPSQ